MDAQDIKILKPRLTITIDPAGISSISQGDNMFSVKQKREIAEKVQKILKETNHPELPSGEISFSLHVNGTESWSWADIRNNGAVINPDVNPWNEAQDAKQN